MNGWQAPRDSFGQTLVELGETHPELFVLNADVAKATKTEAFAARFPDRYLNVGIAEQNMAGVAAGLARSGLVPVMSTFACFAPGRCYDQIRQSIAYSNLNVKIAATHPGLSVGMDGAIHQSLDDLALMRALPGLVVLAPSDAVQTRKALIRAVEHQGPVYLRIGRLECPNLFPAAEDFVIGKAYTLRDGSDVTLIAHGATVQLVWAAAAELERSGVSVRVLDMPSLKPLDREALRRAARETGRIVTVEDHWLCGGLYSAVCEELAAGGPCRIRGIGVGDVFGESGAPGALYAKHGLTQERLLQEVARLLA
ncbi:transketolase [Hydrogenispora ethanolica]|jgi:transketolase|uniref:Transketolase n=1 Tax=Hydrogenispora ethanolica TaxID=1082276 RepID=A0A4R1SBH0_HYDET|nr:transketolase C-terminal domain-containing protein [Hydrogenispora ethanolica]TCL76896.1 transketolase [Hydrogenispora ethanolica]